MRTLMVKKLVVPLALRTNLWLANCYFARDSLGFPALLPFCHAPSGRSFRSSLPWPRLLGPGSVRSTVGESLLEEIPGILNIGADRELFPNRNALPRSDRFPATRYVPGLRLGSLSQGD
jgi:hypothetical protein